MGTTEKKYLGWGKPSQEGRTRCPPPHHLQILVAFIYLGIPVMSRKVLEVGIALKEGVSRTQIKAK